MVAERTTIMVVRGRLQVAAEASPEALGWKKLLVAARGMLLQAAAG